LAFRTLALPLLLSPFKMVKVLWTADADETEEDGVVSEVGEDPEDPDGDALLGL